MTLHVRLDPGGATTVRLYAQRRGSQGGGANETNNRYKGRLSGRRPPTNW
jgi:hypothetical protein